MFRIYFSYLQISLQSHKNKPTDYKEETALIYSQQFFLELQMNVEKKCEMYTFTAETLTEKWADSASEVRVRIR